MSDSRVLQRLKRDRGALAGLALVTIIVAAVAFAPWLAPHDPATIHPLQRLSGPSAGFPLGTDNLGRCLLSRLLHGGRTSLVIATAAASLVVTAGVLLGGVAGYVGGWIDAAVMRVVDLLFAFPPLLIALAVAGIAGAGIEGVLLGVTVAWWAGYARLVRSLMISVREQAYVEAARSVGLSPSRVFFRHALPNVIPPVLALASLDVGKMILATAGLGFLGLGAPPPAPEWGAMLHEGRSFLQSAPALMIYPGLAISLTVLALNLVGDGLRDALDPRG